MTNHLPWPEAGGPKECVHGYALGVACPRCEQEIATVRNSEERRGEIRRECLTLTEDGDDGNPSGVLASEVLWLLDRVPLLGVFVVIAFDGDRDDSSVRLVRAYSDEAQAKIHAKLAAKRRGEIAPSWMWRSICSYSDLGPDEIRRTGGPYDSIWRQGPNLLNEHDPGMRDPNTYWEVEWVPLAAWLHEGGHP